MSYDSSFDQARLDQLADQHLSNRTITGRILFFSAPDGDYAELTTWQLDRDEHFSAVKESGFQLHMIELLHILLAYRIQHDQPNARHGVVNLSGNKLTIEWLPKDEVEAMRNS